MVKVISSTFCVLYAVAFLASCILACAIVSPLAFAWTMVTACVLSHRLLRSIGSAWDHPVKSRNRNRPMLALAGSSPAGWDSASVGEWHSPDGSVQAAPAPLPAVADPVEVIEAYEALPFSPEMIVCYDPAGLIDQTPTVLTPAAPAVRTDEPTAQVKVKPARKISPRKVKTTSTSKAACGPVASQVAPATAPTPVEVWHMASDKTGRPWVIVRDGFPVRGKNGRTRQFATEAAALKASKSL